MSSGTPSPSSWEASSPVSVEEFGADARAVIWVLCHYPDTAEADERVSTAMRLHGRYGLPIWLYGSCSARYPESVERLLKRKLVALGVSAEAVSCSADVPGASVSLDTVQEAYNVAAQAQRQGIRTLVCVSNRLQLLQVKALLRRHPLTFVWVPTLLRERRWWYVAVRLILIPLAFAGIGRHFLPLHLVRWARVHLQSWPF